MAKQRFMGLVIATLAMFPAAGSDRLSNHSTQPTNSRRVDVKSSATINGYLLTYEINGGSIRLVRVAAIVNYIPSRVLAPSKEWRIEQRDDRGDVLWLGQIAGPLGFAPDPGGNQGIQFVAKVPHVFGAQQLVLIDSRGIEVQHTTLDEGFVSAAHQARREFVELMRQNEDALIERAKREGVQIEKTSLDAYGPRDGRMSIPEDVLRIVVAELMEDHEVLEEYGPDVAEVYRGLRQPAFEVARRLGESFEKSKSGQLTAVGTAIPAGTCLLSGTVRDDSGAVIVGARVTLTSGGLSQSLTTLSSGTYGFVVTKGVPLALVVDPPAPHARSLPEPEFIVDADTIKDIVVNDGWVVSGRVRDPALTPLGGVGIIVRHINALTVSQRDWSVSTRSGVDGSFVFVVPCWLQPPDLLISFASESYVRQLMTRAITQSTTIDVAMAKGLEIGGFVRDIGGAGVGKVRVRAYRNGSLAASNLSGSSGAYKLVVEPGIWDIVASPDPGSTSVSSRLAPLEIKGVAVNDASIIRDFELKELEGVLDLRLYFQPNAASYFGALRYEAFRNGRRVAGGYLDREIQYDQGRSRDFAKARFYLSLGRYDIHIFSLGYDPVILRDVEVGVSSSASQDLPAPYLWTGVLREADGSPVVGTSIVSYDNIMLSARAFVSGNGGAFTFPITPGGFVKFFSPEQGTSILRSERLPATLDNRNQDLILDRFVPLGDGNGVVSQFFGTPDRTNRFNLVYIAESFTSLRETYQDTNRNGLWDGVLFLDYNLNGRYDNGEPYTQYGAASPPSVGSDPLLTNEPFQDINHDGFPSFDDLAVFDRNTIDTTRSLFGHDFWQDNRDLFNAFRIHVVSNQAGFDVVDADGKTLLSRNTAFGALLSLTRNTLGANYSLISQTVNEYLPEADTIIALINQPVRAGRANSFILTKGGPAWLLANNYTIAHEMGHNVGRLGDEYTEYPETYLLGETSSPNTTVFSLPNQIPWRDLISADRELPSIDPSGGIGLFEGARYYVSGIFRPTAYCMMVSGNRYCPVCMRELEYRTASLRNNLTEAPQLLAPTGSTTSLSPRFTWTPVPHAAHYRLELRRSPDESLVGIFEIYDQAWTPSFALEVGRDYRWRLSAGVEQRWGPWSAWSSFQTSRVVRRRFSR